ncbi:HAD family hydrolase [Motilimonas pumila]|uniref:HAD family phosphatase n=1 Tax=Motilimonas pumila TaxID=2303987 RepID=A0A418YK10_9GAMM|nr:HAD family phosphatase [Motilimonas pumila]RJG51318.1 HAD family phosphatase [Motilimonas pumila]
MNVQAAIFDMDGLLLDTERVCMTVFKQACDACDVPFLEQTYLSVIGCNAKGVEQGLRAGYDSLIDYDTLHQAWRERYDAVVKHQAIPVKAGVIALLTWLQQQSIPIAVATSTANEVANIKLRLAGLAPYFVNVTTGCEVAHGKPAPDIYLLAAKRLGVSPQHCIAFEDSNNGVRAAVAAQMTTFQIPDLVAPNEQVLALGHQVMPSLAHVLTHLQQTG